MLDLPLLVDQNMVCGSNADHFPRIHLDVSLFSGIHQICIPTFPFDSPTQSDTYSYIYSCMTISYMHIATCVSIGCYRTVSRAAELPDAK